MNRLIFLIISFFYCVTLLFGQIKPNLLEKTNKEDMTHWVDSVFNTMSLDDKIGQLFMPLIDSDESWKGRINGYIKSQKVGGFLFTKTTMVKQARMTNYIQGITNIPLFVALDGEWGLYMRMPDAPAFPRNMILGAISDEAIVRQYAKEVARECKEIGIHINFAPVVDINSNQQNPVIGTRSFGEIPEAVAKHAIAYSAGLEDNGVMAVAKHFPGHGDTSEDSHHTLPTISHPISRLDSVELFPFREYVNAGFSGVMVGHLNVPALNTKGMPASLSHEVVDNLLKQKMGFDGLTFTDGMAMKGVSSQPDMSVKAILAGNDIILGVINQEKEFNSVKKAVENGTISSSLIDQRVKKILSYKFALNVHKFTPIDINGLALQVKTSETEWTQRKIYDGALTLLKNNDSLVPITDLDKTKIASVVIGSSLGVPFQNYLQKYADVKLFAVQSAADLSKIEKELETFDLVILSIHSDRINDNAVMQTIAKKKNTISVFFTAPKVLSSLRGVANYSKSVMVAYDNSDFAHHSAAQGLFGGIPITGKLPVSEGPFKALTGVDTEKTRLSYSSPEEVGISAAKLKKIESLALEGIRQKAFPGCYVLVAKDGVVIYDRGFGNFEYKSSHPVDERTVYDLASVTKAMATLPAIMKLYDDKKIKLLDQLGTYIPEARASNKENINIRQALFHETGIVSFIPYYKVAIDENSYEGDIMSKRYSPIYHVGYGDVWMRTDYKFIPSYISYASSATHNQPVAKDLYASEKMKKALLKEIINTDLRKSKNYRYSCLNFMLLKEVVENVAKTDLNSYVRANFYQKLGAVTTTFQPLKYMPIDNIPPTENDPFFRRQLIRGYVHDEGAALFGNISGNAGLFSNANDMAKICQMWLNGGEYGGQRFLRAETVNLFTKTKSGSSRRGLGFDRPDPKNTNSSPTAPIVPLSVYGHTGFTGTCFWIDPDNNLIYIFLSNRVYPSRSPNRLSTLEIRERIQNEIYKSFINPVNNTNLNENESGDN